MRTYILRHIILASVVLLGGVAMANDSIAILDLQNQLKEQSEIISELKYQLQDHRGKELLYSDIIGMNVNWFICIISILIFAIGSFIATVYWRKWNNIGKVVEKASKLANNATVDVDKINEYMIKLNEYLNLSTFSMFDLLKKEHTADVVQILSNYLLICNLNKSVFEIFNDDKKTKILNDYSNSERINMVISDLLHLFKEFAEKENLDNRTYPDIYNGPQVLIDWFYEIYFVEPDLFKGLNDKMQKIKDYQSKINDYFDKTDNKK